MTIGTRSAYISFLLSRSRAVSTSDIGLLFGLGLHFTRIIALRPFCSSFERYTIKNNVIDVVAAVLITHNIAIMRWFLMMEQSYASESHGDTVLITCLYDMVITDTAASLCHILYS